MRRCVEDDLEAVLYVAEEFFKDTHEEVPNRSMLKEVVRECITKGIAVISEDADSITGVFLGYFTYNVLRNQREAHELMWWSLAGHGVRLVRRAEAIAREHGAWRLYMSVIGTDKEARSHQAITMLGYEALEINYRKEL